MIAAIVLAIAAVAGARCAEAEERIANAQGELLRAYEDGGRIEFLVFVR
jgi:Tfp pilus assembly protein PilX